MRIFTSKHLILKFILPIYLFLFTCLPANGQTYTVDIKSWGVKDGLSNRQVNYICKDSYGFMWLCTPNGLNRFDGYSFKTYNSEKDHLPFDNLGGMVQDNNGCFWVMGSEFFQNPDNNLFIFNPLTGKSISFKEKTGYKETFRFNVLQKFNDSTLFIGNLHDPYFFTWSEGSGLQKKKYPARLKNWLTTTTSNTFWALDSTNFFCEISKNGELLHRCPSNGDSLYFWPVLSLFSTAMIKPMPGQKNTYKPVMEVTEQQNIASLSMYNSNGQSLPYQYALQYNFDGITLQDLLSRLDPLHTSYCTGIIIESNNVVWLSSGFGLVRITVIKNKFRKYFYHEGQDIRDNSYRALVVNNNTLYAVNEVTGILEANLSTGAQQIFTPFTQVYKQLYCLTKTSDGKLFGLRVNDEYGWDKHWWALTHEQLTKGKDETAEPPRITWKIAELAKDSFLTGGWQGLKYYNFTKHQFTSFINYNAYTSLASSLVIEIVDDSDGQKWLCSNTGLYLYDGVKGIIARYSSADTGTQFLPTADVHHVYCDSGGIYWLATTNGLIRWDRTHHTYRLLTIVDGLSNNNIYEVYGDNKNRLWMGSDYGLMQLDKNTLKVKTYLADDGISYNEFNRLSHTRDDAGNLYFGTLNGVTAFNPDDFSADDNIHRAPLAVSSFEQFDGNAGKLVDKTEALLQTSSITLQPGDRFFNINLALLTFNDAIHTTYYWKIDEMDSSWTSFKEPALRLSGLPYGNLKLHIKAQAGDGTPGSNELLFTINVIKPFYLRTWFISLVLLIIAAGIFMGFRWRTYLLKKENIRLDKIVKEKTSELEQTISQLELSSQQKDVLMKEIHHRVKNNLQVISTLLNLQLSNITDEKARQSLEESASRISSIALVHFQLYHQEDLTTIELSNFLHGLLQQVSPVYIKPGQDISLQNDVKEVWLDIDTALPLGLIMNELMTNSFKYAYTNTMDCRMRIWLERSGDIYTLCYCDNGPGLPENYDLKNSKSLGSSIIRSLTKQLGGSFLYNRETNCFIITFRDTPARKTIA